MEDQVTIDTYVSEKTARVDYGIFMAELSVNINGFVNVVFGSRGGWYKDTDINSYEAKEFKALMTVLRQVEEILDNNSLNLEENSNV